MQCEDFSLFAREICIIRGYSYAKNMDLQQKSQYGFFFPPNFILADKQPSPLLF